MGRLAGSIGDHISEMKASLKDVDCLAVNSRIAAAGIHAAGNDFATFADEIGRTLVVTKQALDLFEAELRVVRQHVTTAHTGQMSFETRQRDAARSITERLSATVKSIASRNHRAARASLEVRLGSARVRQRICDAIVALQIGDITRQRLEHADDALRLVATLSAPDNATLETDEKRPFAVAAHRLQSAQLSDAARDYDGDVRQIVGSLNSLAAEARGLRNLGDAAYGSADRDGGGFLRELEGQIGEALALFEDFETARAEVAEVTASVSRSSASLCSHLRTVQMLEADIRIMGLNTTFRCARIGREGLALSIIAQELRGYANGFAKEADALMREVEAVAAISLSLTGDTASDQASRLADGTRAMRESLDTLRHTGQSLELAMAELEQDSHRVELLLMAAVAKLEEQRGIGQVLHDAAEAFAPSEPIYPAHLPAGAERMLERIAAGYTMANERTVFERVLGRSIQAAPAPVPELEDFLF